MGIKYKIKVLSLSYTSRLLSQNDKWRSKVEGKSMKNSSMY